MKRKPLISIITPSYNQGRFIEGTLISVKNQIYPKKEHIVVDGGSTDNTLGVLKKYEDKYNLRWISEPDEGQSEAVNKGFDMSNGEIIGWLNSDDVYYDRKTLTYVVNAFRSNSLVDVVYGNDIWINQDGLILRLEKVSPWISYDRLLRGNLWLSQPSVFLRRRVIEKYKLDTKLEYSMDYEFWIRLLKNKKNFKYINKYLSCERLHSHSKTVSSEKKGLKENEIIRKKYGHSVNFKDQFLFIFYKFVKGILLLEGLTQIPKIYNKRMYEFTFQPKFRRTSELILSQLPLLSRVRSIKVLIN